MFQKLLDNARAIVLAVIVHLVLLAMLIVNLDWTPKTQQEAGASKVVDAVVVDESQIQNEVNRLQRADEERAARLRREEQKAEEARHAREAEEKRLADVQRRQAEEERARQRVADAAKQAADALRQAQEDAAEARQEAQEERARIAEERHAEEVKRKVAEEQRQKTEADAKRKAAAEEQRQQAEADAKRKAAAEEQRQKAEAEAKRKAAEEARNKEDAENDLKEQLDREAQGRAEAAAKGEQARQDQGVIERYKGMIQSKVERSWLRPMGSEHNIVCDVSVSVLSNGAVASVVVKHCTGGDAAYVRSVELAVNRASPLPLPSDPRLADQFVREAIHFNFKPRER